MFYIYDNINNYSNHEYDKFNNYLKDEDIKKIESFIYNRNKLQYILSRVILSKTLYNKYKIGYKDCIIKYNKYNKPYINKIYFNISHSFDYSIVGFSNNKIGIDIEKIREVDISIINFFCSSWERNYIINSKDKYRSLFIIFCLKEAYFKMIGTGIINPKSIEFRINNNHITCLNNKYINIILDESIKDYIIVCIGKK